VLNSSGTPLAAMVSAGHRSVSNGFKGLSPPMLGEVGVRPGRSGRRAVRAVTHIELRRCACLSIAATGAKRAILSRIR